MPPPNWISLINIPPEISKNAIVVFSNNNKSQLATFSIFMRPVSQDVIDAVNKYSDNDVLYSIAKELSGKSSDSKTAVLAGAIDRYNDGIRVAMITNTTYTSDNSTSVSENVIYFLNSGSQYTLVLTTSPSNFDKDSILFEQSANSFLVNQTSQENQRTQIPLWIKNNAKLWSGDSLSNANFTSGIQYLIDNGIMNVPQIQSGPHQLSGVPSWLKINARLWAQGQISDSEFVSGIQYLINKGIITS